MKPRLADLLRALALPLALGLAGCATLSAEQCRNAKWEDMGRAEGRKGGRVEALDQHREACAGHGIAPNADDWRRGYEHGVDEFCTPAGGYNTARVNLGDEALCAGRSTEREFLAARRNGDQVYALLQQVREMYRELRLLVMQGYSGVQLSNSELVESLERQQLWLQQRDGVFCDQYGVERLTDADFDPDSAGRNSPAPPRN